jgi:ketosteroid isomerase-like protein
MCSPDEKTLTSIFEVELPARVRAADVDGYMSLWGGADPMWCIPDQPDAHGLDAIRAGVSALLAEDAIDATFTADAAVVLADRGYVNGTSRELVMPRNGGPTTIVYTREIWLFIRDAGTWKINCIVFKHSPPPVPATP